MKNHDLLMGTNTAQGYKQWSEGKKDISDDYTTENYNTYYDNNGKNVKRKSSSSSSKTKSSSGGSFKIPGINTAQAVGDSFGTLQQKDKGFWERTAERIKDPFGLEPRKRALTMSQPFQDSEKDPSFWDLLKNFRSPDKIYQTEEGLGDSVSQFLDTGYNPKYKVEDFEAPKQVVNQEQDVFTYDEDDYYPSVENVKEKETQRNGDSSYNNGKPSIIDSSIYSTPVKRDVKKSYQDLFRPQDPKFTYNPTEQTDNRFLGNGYLAGGQYGNGAGLNPDGSLPDFGYGSLGFEEGENEGSLIRKLLGINTANAYDGIYGPNSLNQSLKNSQNNNQGNQNAYINDLDSSRFAPGAEYGENSVLVGYDQGGPIFKQREKEEDNKITKDYGQTNTGGGGNMSRTEVDGYPKRGKMSRREYKKAYGIDYADVEAAKDPMGFGKEKDETAAYGRQQQKLLAQQLEAALGGINTEFDISSREGQEQLDRAKRQDLQKQDAMFSFGLNQDPNSGQRRQYSERMASDYGNKMTKYLRDLNESKNAQILQARSGNMDRQMDMNQQLQQLLQGIASREDQFAYRQEDRRNAIEDRNFALRNRAGSAPTFGGYDDDGRKQFYTRSGDLAYTGGYGDDPTAVGTPQRSNNPIPAEVEVGGGYITIDNNPYSPTYGQEIEQY